VSSEHRGRFVSDVALSTETFLLTLTFGAGMLAFWTCVRFPERGPQGLVMPVLHLLASMVIANIALALLPASLGIATYGLYIGLFGLVLPPLTYMMLSGMWIIRGALSAASPGIG